MTEITDDSWENTQKTHMNTAIKYDCKNNIFHKINQEYVLACRPYVVKS